MKNIELNTTEEEFHETHMLVDKGRSKAVSVKRSVIVNLLMDHSNMVKRLESLGDIVVSETAARKPNVWGSKIKY
jgi:hypothetical protein